MSLWSFDFRSHNFTVLFTRFVLTMLSIVGLHWQTVRMHVQYSGLLQPVTTPVEGMPRPEDTPLRATAPQPGDGGSLIYGLLLAGTCVLGAPPVQ